MVVVVRDTHALAARTVNDVVHSVERLGERQRFPPFLLLCHQEGQGKEGRAVLLSGQDTNRSKSEGFFRQGDKTDAINTHA